jgi:hypothetical protein
MGKSDNSLTRVHPVFNHLLNRSPDGRGWLTELCEMAAATRPDKGWTPSDPGQLLPREPPETADERVGVVFERLVPPPTEFLRWLIAHPTQMDVVDRKNFNARSESAREARRKLFSSDAKESAKAQREALCHLTALGAPGSRRAWWAFEGFTHVDCCLMTERFVLFVEGKRTEAVSSSTRWFANRSQLWRNVEAAKEFGGGREAAVILAVESESQGLAALRAAESRLAGSLPHLSPAERAGIDRRFLGFVTWPALKARFDLPDKCFPHSVADLISRPWAQPFTPP